MINPKQIEAYCKEQGWNCSTSHGKKNGKRTIYPMVWRQDGDKHLSNWQTIVIYRDEINFTEMTKIMDEAFKTITAEYSKEA